MNAPCASTRAIAAVDSPGDPTPLILQIDERDRRRSAIRCCANASAIGDPTRVSGVTRHIDCRFWGTRGPVRGARQLSTSNRRGAREIHDERVRRHVLRLRRAAGRHEAVGPQRHTALIVALAPIVAPRPHERLAEFVLALDSARGLRTLVNTMLGPQKTPSSSDAVVDADVVLILQWSPIVTSGPIMTFWPWSSFVRCGFPSECG